MQGNKRNRTVVNLASVLTLVMAAAAAQAAMPPEVVNFEGVLRDSSGVPENGAKDMVFYFYDTDGGASCPASGGTLLLTDSHLAAGSGAVTVTDGLFNVEMGGGAITAGAKSSLAEVFRDYSSVYVAAEVNTEVLCPRIHVTSAGYAFNASNLGGKTAAEFIDTSITAQTKTGTLKVDVPGLEAIRATSPAFGVWAESTVTSGTGYGVYAVANGDAGKAVLGTAQASSGDAYGVTGTSASTSGRGVYGKAFATSGTNYGVYGESSSASGYGGYFLGRMYVGQRLGIGTSPAATVHLNVGGTASNDTLLLGNTTSKGLRLRDTGGSVDIEAFGVPLYLNNTGQNTLVNPQLGGNVGIGTTNPTFKLHVIGSVSKTSGSFQIDHPLDPANKYLFHSFVESPDMMNVYNGNATTDDAGEAVILLPEWFEALNKDFRYQLTVIGEMAQATIEKKIEKNRFAIRTDRPNVEVSWQVTGIRRDPWAEQHRIPVEMDKPEAERGTYLHPEVHGKPRELGVAYVKPQRFVESTTLAHGVFEPSVEPEPEWKEPAARVVESAHRRADDERIVYAQSFRSSATDLASLVRVTEPVEAGDLLVIDCEHPGTMRLAREPGDTAVFGIVAAAPGVVLGAAPRGRERLDAEADRIGGSGAGPVVDEAGTVEVPVAVSGVVQAKVDAGYGSIRPGDLLVTSPTAGHAMRSDDPRPGTILGKALESLDVGTGLIRVLVVLR